MMIMWWFPIGWHRIISTLLFVLLFGIVKMVKNKSKHSLNINIIFGVPEKGGKHIIIYKFINKISKSKAFLSTENVWKTFGFFFFLAECITCKLINNNIHPKQKKMMRHQNNNWILLLSTLQWKKRLYFALEKKHLSIWSWTLNPSSIYTTINHWFITFSFYFHYAHHGYREKCIFEQPRKKQ